MSPTHPTPPWQRGKQDEQWQRRALELAEARDPIRARAAIWRHVASMADGDTIHRFAVPSGSWDLRVYAVTAHEYTPADDSRADQLRFTFTCECTAHGWGSPCTHIGAALYALAQRDAAIEEADRLDAQADYRAVWGSWLNGGDW